VLCPSQGGIWQQWTGALVRSSRWLGDSEWLRHYFILVVGNFFWKRRGICSSNLLFGLREVLEVDEVIP